METIFKWLVAGYVVGAICMFYLIVRSWIITNAMLHGKGSALYRREIGVNWLGMALLSAGVSLGWSLIGGGIHRFLASDVLFVQFSLGLAAVITTMLLFADTEHKLDKIALNAIVILGFGFLLPVML